MVTTRTSSLSSDTVVGLFDELSKIASEQKPGNPQLKKFLKSTAVIGAGAGAGYGAAMIADKAFQHAFGAKWAALGSPSKKKLIGAAIGLATAGVLVGKEWNAHERREALK